MYLELLFKKFLKRHAFNHFVTLNVSVRPILCDKMPASPYILNYKETEESPVMALQETHDRKD